MPTVCVKTIRQHTHAEKNTWGKFIGGSADGFQFSSTKYLETGGGNRLLPKRDKKTLTVKL